MGKNIPMKRDNEMEVPERSDTLHIESAHMTGLEIRLVKEFASRNSIIAVSCTECI